MARNLLTDDFVDSMLALPSEEQAHVLSLLEELEDAEERESARESFAGFRKAMWPDVIDGRHLKIMAEAFDRVLSGECRRLIINMPPRHSKSENASYLLPAYFFGKFPRKKVIMASHNAELAVGFGRKVRNLVNSPRFHDVFPGTTLTADSKASGRWATNEGGEYFAIGVGGKLAGRGADLLIIDDPVSEQEAMQAANNPDIFHTVFEWYSSGPRQRLQPGAAIIVVMTRWSTIDLTGLLIDKMVKEPIADQWEVIEFPAILNDKPLWPEFWSMEELAATKASIPIHQWAAQYLQHPTSEEGAIIKRDWWQVWPEANPPPVEMIMISWDTAFEKTQRADYSACTTWGVFYRENEEGKKVANLIMLDAFRDKYEFPELKVKVQAHYKKWDPDILLIEKRGSGSPLVYELRAMGTPVSEFTPVRGNDKFVRANSVADIFKSGLVWAPDKQWAHEVIEECASFPYAPNDDYVDSMTQALMRFRAGGLIRTKLDEDDDRPKRRHVPKYY